MLPVTSSINQCYSSDFKYKPMLMYQSKTPMSKRAYLPLFWQFKNKSHMMAKLFEDWFNHCFIKKVEKYLEQKNLHFKTLFWLDNKPRYILCSHQNSQSSRHQENVLFSEHNTYPSAYGSGVNKSFKTHYRQVIHSQANTTSDSMLNFWKPYKIHI